MGQKVSFTTDQVKQGLTNLCNEEQIPTYDYDEVSSLVRNEGISLVKRKELLTILQTLHESGLISSNEPFVQTSYQLMGSIVIIKEIKDKLSEIKNNASNLGGSIKESQSFTSQVNEIMEKFSIKTNPQDAINVKVNLLDKFISQLLDDFQNQQKQIQTLQTEKKESDSKLTALLEEQARTFEKLELVQRDLNQEKQLRVKSELELEEKEERFQNIIREKDELIQDLTKERNAATLNLKTLQKSMELLNSGEVINSQAQQVVESCIKMISKIDSRCVDFVLESGLPDSCEKYIYILPNIIFTCQFENPNIGKEELFRMSWEKMLNSTEDDQLKKLLTTGETIFSEIVSIAFELYFATKTLKFPKVSLLWIGCDGVVYSSTFFDVLDFVIGNAENSTAEELVSALPALVLGDNKKVEYKGTAFKRFTN